MHLLFIGSMLGSAVAAPPTDATRALRLPVVAEQLRDASVADDQVVALLAATRAAGLTTRETHDLLWHATALARSYGPLDDLARIASEALDRGLRGEELSAELTGQHLSAQERAMMSDNQPGAL